MMEKHDLDSPERIREFIERFYERVLADDLLAPIFLDVAGIDIQRHLSIICSYWEKLILGRDTYHRHTMNIHRALHAKKPLEPREFQRWLALFSETLDEGFSGPGAERARRVAAHIARNMQIALIGHEESGRD